MSAPGIIEFITDPEFLGLTRSAAQETLPQAIYGLPVSDHHLDRSRL
ncbi:MAG: hypothetical protein HYV93_10375 [Candidatus Rokubacteria bacterium]|nr:hypothetical protein [Candidatus Rokubacteria bacterium]